MLERPNCIRGMEGSIPPAGSNCRCFSRSSNHRRHARISRTHHQPARASARRPSSSRCFGRCATSRFTRPAPGATSRWRLPRMDRSPWRGRRREAAVQRAQRRHARVFRRGVSRAGDGRAARARECTSRGADPSRAYLLALQEQDPSFPAGLNGRFHGLADRSRARTATLFNDRYGMHRLYYHAVERRVLFRRRSQGDARGASRAATPDPRGAGRVRRLRLRPREPHAVRGRPRPAARRRRGGSATAPSSDKHSYFQPASGSSRRFSIRRRITASSARCSRESSRAISADPEPVGMSLTGGLDTPDDHGVAQARARLAALLQFGGTFRDCQDARWRGKSRGSARNRIRSITVGGEFLSRFSRYAERTVYLTDGCAEVSRAAGSLRERAGARDRSRPDDRQLRRRSAAPRAGVQAGRAAPGAVPSGVRCRTSSGASRRTRRCCRAIRCRSRCSSRRPGINYGLLALEQTQLSMRSPFLDNDFVRTVFRAPAVAYASNDVCLRLIADGDPALARIPTDRGVGGGAGRWRRRLARAARIPVQGGIRLRLRDAAVGGLGRSTALSPLRLERQFLGRHKFYHYRLWYRDGLAGYVREMLLDPRTLSRPYLERRSGRDRS